MSDRNMERTTLFFCPSFFCRFGPEGRLGNLVVAGLFLRRVRLPPGRGPKLQVIFHPQEHHLLFQATNSASSGGMRIRPCRSNSTHCA